MKQSRIAGIGYVALVILLLLNILFSNFYKGVFATTSEMLLFDLIVSLAIVLFLQNLARKSAKWALMLAGISSGMIIVLFIANYRPTIPVFQSTNLTFFCLSLMLVSIFAGKLTAFIKQQS
ncbi:hypothetical protein [Lapidilactobacillus wuchangensis]|uniref:hypothetical protein n=1 Tax=Lapidilactobacillus wuchangensis TaxID=2486001 RepID=UPI000F7B021A|nr:hypothetical protein [Lapidilactobacillus wuchangensis]